MKKTVFDIKFIVGTAVLTAIEVLFYILGTLFNFSGISINLALVPIAIGAIVYGPVCGAVLGFVNGACVLLTPNTWGLFFDTELLGNLCLFGTPLICLLKCTAAGAIAGVVNKAISPSNEVLAAVLASFIVPIVNTSIFLALGSIFYTNILSTLLEIVFTFNLLVEIGVTALLAPAIIRITQFYLKKIYGKNGQAAKNENE